MSILCELGKNLEKAFRDEIVHEVKKRTLKEELYETPYLTYEKTKDIGQVSEGAEKILENFHESSYFSW